MRHMALRTIFITDRITGMLIRECRITLRMTTRAKLRRFVCQKPFVIAAMHIMTRRAAIR